MKHNGASIPTPEFWYLKSGHVSIFFPYFSPSGHCRYDDDDDDDDDDAPIEGVPANVQTKRHGFKKHRGFHDKHDGEWSPI